MKATLRLYDLFYGFILGLECHNSGNFNSPKKSSDNCETGFKRVLRRQINLMQLVGFLYNQMQILSFLWFKMFWLHTLVAFSS